MQQLSIHEYAALQSHTQDSIRVLYRERGESHLQYYSKRLLDTILAASACIVLLPLFLLIGLLIKIDSSGPIFFVQERVGARRSAVNRKPVWKIRHFRLYKFRSMFHNADQSVHEAYIKAFVAGTLPVSEANGAKFKLNHDPRVTRIGSLLRKTSLDELPQLINILKGEMSLVGPRPVPPYEVAEYQPHHYERLATLPGLTGLWQIKGRGRVSFEEMMEMDIEYVKTQSFWLDLKFLLLTVPAVLFRLGAQ